MKITPLAQGTGVHGAADVGSPNRSVNPDRLARAKAIALGQEPQESTGDTQVDKVQSALKTIKMKTNASVFRDGPPEVAVEAPLEVAPEPVAEQVPNPDVVEAQPSEDTRPLSPQFAALAKQKRALQVKERELAQREEALKAPQSSNTEELIARLKSNPLSVLQENGISYDQLTEAILNSPAPAVDPVKLRNEIKEELKKELLGEFSTRDEQQEKQVLAELTREINLVTAEGEDFEAIRQAKAQPEVRDLIHRTFKETGELMDVVTAAKLVENQLIEEAIPFAKIKKLQSRLTPQEEALVEQVAATPVKPGTKVMRTLTNRDSARPVMDRKSRAIAAFNGTNKRG